jgi:LAS superfamily LD-carboxypeptidase LdcB
MDRDKAIRAAKLTLGGMLEKKRHTTAVSRADGQIAPSKYMPNVPRAVHAYGGRANENDDIFWHGSPSGDLRGGTSGLHLGTKEAALDALRARIGVPADGSMWDGTKPYGETLLAGKNTLNKMGKYLISGHNVNAPDEDYYPHQHPKGFPTVGNSVPVDPQWKPFLRPFKITGGMSNSRYSPHGDTKANSMMKASLTKGNAKNGYYYTNDAEDSGSISAVVPNGSHITPVDQALQKASGGAANAPMFQDIHPSLQGESGAPLDLYHGTTQDKEFEAFDDSKLGVRDVGFFGRGHYMTPHRDTAQLYAGANEDDGTVIGPLHAALKNPYVWDVSDDMKSQGTLRDLQSMGIMRDKNKLRSWDNLQQHHIQPFMAEMKKRGHDGVVVKTGHEHLPNGIAEVVAFDPKTIKHTEAEAFDPNDPRIRRDDGGRVTDTDEFRNWFGNSVTHTNGDPHVLYTGTSKDKDFTSHNVGRHGAWFVRDPEAASSYAEQNDSQGYKREGFKLTPTNTASRVIPAYVRAENPYTGELPEEYLRDNYKAAQSEWFDTLRANGHDSWVPASQNGNLVVALKEPQQIKSIFNSGKFDPNQKHMNKATGGPVMGYVPMATLPTRRLINAPIQQQQPQGNVGTFSQSLNSLMDTVEGFKKKPEEEAVTTETAPTGTIPLPEQGYQASGMYAPFQSAIDRMIADAPGKISVASGYRTPQRQEELWNEAAAKYPDPELRDNYVARAGQSSHNYGLAADLSYADEAALKWAQENAAKYGLNFRMGHEDWHIEPANIWDLRKAMTVQGYADGGSVMDDNNNVTDLSTVRARNDATSSDHTYGAKDLFSDFASRYAESQKAFDMAHSSGAFDNFQLGDTFKSKTSPNADPIKIVRFTVQHADRYPQATKLFNNHYPALEMEVQNSDRKTYPTSLENFENNLHKYDRIAGKPRLVKAGGGEIDQQNGDMENDTAPNNLAARPQAGGLPIAGGIRGGAGVLQTQNEAPLEGLPQKVGIPLTGGSVSAGPDPRIRQVARDYMASTGMQYNPPTKYVKADPSRARRIGAAYEAMKDDPNEPLTKASYAAMISETMAQYNAAKKAGLKVEFWNPEKQADPYGASPRLATEDVRNNHHMWVYPTYAGYGSGDPISEDDAKKNPLLQLTGETWNGIPVTVNDVFRAIHDYYGHAKEGVGFRADGEENAWRAHASMFSPLARMAMTSETRGQNSWLNYGPHGEKNRTARTEDTVFAPQKIGVLPHWAHHEGAEDFTLPEDVDAMHRIRSNFDPVVSKALSLTRGFTKDGKSAISNIKPKGK